MKKYQSFYLITNTMRIENYFNFKIQIQFPNCAAKVKVFCALANSSIAFRMFYNIVLELKRSFYTYKHL